METEARGRWLVFGATFFWGTTATLARYVFRDHHVPPLTAVELRLFIATALLGLWLVARKPALLVIERRDWGHMVVLGIMGLAAVQGSYYYSIAHLGVGLAILLQYLAPCLIVLYDLARGGRIGRRTALAVVAALAGTALLIGDVDPIARRAGPLQWAVGFSSAIWFAFYVLYSKGRLRRYAPETVLFYTFSIAAIFWGIVTPPWRIIAAGYDLRLWGMFLALALFSTLVPFALFYAGLRRMPATEAGVLATLEPVIAVVSAALVLGEALRPQQNLGALFVLVAAILATSRERAGR
jgi:drug/metabolite transporter (DMT)-like permease